MTVCDYFSFTTIIGYICNYFLCFIVLVTTQQLVINVFFVLPFEKLLTWF